MEVQEYNDLLCLVRVMQENIYIHDNAIGAGNEMQNNSLGLPGIMTFALLMNC